MPQIINTNLASINAQRNLDKSQSANQTALQRLSSGLRINSAKDDAAGMAISTRFTSQIKGLNVAIRNAGDGIALAQTAEGALGSMNDNLQRIRELAVQSSNATNSDVDRQALQAEVEQLVAEITRTSNETDFNGRKLLDGSFNATFQIGANAGQTVDISIAKLTADKLGAGSANGISAMGSGKGLQNGDLMLNGIAIDPSKPGSDTYSYQDNAASAIAKVAAINAKSAQTGVTAVVNSNVAVGSQMTPAAANGIIKLNGVDIEVSTGGQDAASDRSAVITAINAKAGQTGITARDGGDGAGVVLEAKDGRNITTELGGSLTESNTGLSAGTSYAGYTLISKNGSDIKVAGGQGTGTGDIRNSGLTVGTFSGREAAVTSKTTSAGISNKETASTFTTADLSVQADTIINATNNSFEVAINGEGFKTLTLGTNFDAGTAAVPAVGKYSNVEQLAAQINAAISDSNNDAYASNAAFRDAEGNALFTARADGNKLVFEAVDKGDDSSIVARTGAGSIALATDTNEQNGVDGGTFTRLKLNYVFDGVNSPGTGAITIAIAAGAGGTPAAITAASVAVGAAADKSAEAFAAALNTGIAAVTTLNGKVQAVVSEDGRSVFLESMVEDAGAITLGLTGTGDLTMSAEAKHMQHLSNGDAVILDPNAYFAGIIAGTSTVGIAVGEQPVQQLTFVADPGVVGSGMTFANATLSNATVDDKVQYLNELFAAQLAGSGISASNVGGQIVVSGNNGESVKFTTGTSTPVAGLTTATDMVSAMDSRVEVATSGTAQTGKFNVDADGNFLGAGSTNKQPLVIEAGKNDTFTMALDGGAAKEIKIAAGSYANLSELSSSINTAYAQAASKIDVANLGSALLADFNFGGNTGADDIELSLKLDGGAAKTITVTGNYSGAADVDAAKAGMLSELQTKLDTEFGANKIKASISDDGVLQIARVGGALAGSVEMTVADTGVGASGAITTAAAGSTIPAMTVSVTDDKQSLVFTSGTKGETSAVDITNGTFAIEGGATVGTTVTDFTKPNVLKTGDLLINGTSIQGASAKDDTASDTTALTSDAAGSGIAVAATINKSTAQTGVTATVNATTLNGGKSVTDPALKADAGSTGKLIINNVETTTFSLTGDAGRDRQAAIDSINAIAGRTGVTATDNGESITLTAADGRNISVAIDNQLASNALNGRDSSNFGAAIGLSSDQAGVGEADISDTSATYATTAGTTYSTVTLTSAKAIKVEAGENGAVELDAMGLQAGTFGGGENGTFLKDLDISTFEGAQAALVAVDNAIAQVASQRADLGAIQNRMESTVSNLQVTSENLNAANSRIRDADFAAETAEMSRTQVLQQAGISILAQANAAGQNVLSLLG